MGPLPAVHGARGIGKSRVGIAFLRNHSSAKHPLVLGLPSKCVGLCLVNEKMGREINQTKL